MCGGGGGGDGGAADRKAAEDKRIAEAIRKVNTVLGVENARPAEIDRADFTTTTPASGGGENGTYTPGTTTFDQAGYDAAVAQAAADAAASNTAFSERSKLYDTVRKDSTDHALIDLNKDRTTTERDFGFDVARAGLSGGSRDIDVNKDIFDTYQQGVLKASTLGDQAANTARAADDKTRIGLIDSIRTGLDQGSAVNQAYTQMSNNANQATTEAGNVALAGFFDRLNNLNQQRKYNNGMTAGQTVVGGGGTSSGPSGPTSFNGTVR